MSKENWLKIIAAVIGLVVGFLIVLFEGGAATIGLAAYGMLAGGIVNLFAELFKVQALDYKFSPLCAGLGFAGGLVGGLLGILL